jgi:hypothetical protein
MHPNICLICLLLYGLFVPTIACAKVMNDILNIQYAVAVLCQVKMNGK